MKYQSGLKWLVLSISVLAGIAAGMGLFYQTPGTPHAVTSFRGEKVTVNGHGLYFYDTVSTAAQMQGNDLITLVVGLPLLAVAERLAFHGSLRGKLLLTGTLGFFLYTYMSMSMLAAYNALFLVYVGLFGLSLYTFALSMLAIDVAELPRHFSPRLPRGRIATVLFLVGGFLALAWIGRVLPELLNSQPPAALENTTTRVIQAMDLTLIAPLAILGGLLLLRRNSWGYLLASVAVLKGLTMTLAVSTMGSNMVLAGVPDSLGILIPFPVQTLLNLAAAVVLLKNIDAAQPVARGTGHLNARLR
jgi:hypothetical protein